jgi:hypothetical protein
VLFLHLRDHGERRTAPLLDPLPDRLGARLDSRRCLEAENRAVGRAQPGREIPREVRVSRRVDQVDLVSAPLDRRDADADRDLPVNLSGEKSSAVVPSSTLP